MKVNNIDSLKEYISYHLQSSITGNDEFLLFEIVVRKKDNPENIYMKAHRDSVAIKSWYIDSVEKFDKYIDEMIYTSDKTGGRLYMSCNVKSTKKYALTCIERVNKLSIDLISNNMTSLKKLSNLSLSCAASENTDIRNKRTYMIDVDTKDENTLHELTKKVLIANKAQRIFTFDTPNGYHIISRKFNLDFINLADFKDIEVKENAMLLVYYNNEQEKKGKVPNALHRLFRKD